MTEKKKKWPKVILCIILAIVLLVVLLFAVLTITEFKPKDSEAVDINGTSSKELNTGDSFSIMTWNVGYCGLGETSDFFMDGGKEVRSSDKKTVENNIKSISDYLAKEDADVIFLQEVDISSKRSYHLNEMEGFFQEQNALETDYMNTYAPNYKVLYVPYPFPTIGKVDCGITTLSKFNVTDSTREALPCPFKYPVRIANLKRCLMVNRIPVKNSNKELVVVNLHLEAYDSGEGKIAQTKQLRELLESEAKKGNYVIAGGDFNQTFSNCDTSAYPLVSEEMWTPGIIDVEEFDDFLQFVMDPSSPSCRSLDRPIANEDTSPDKFQYYMIDGFIVSDNLEINSIETKDLKFKNTDHQPVVMNVTVK